MADNLIYGARHRTSSELKGRRVKNRETGKTNVVNKYKVRAPAGCCVNRVFASRVFASLVFGSRVFASRVFGNRALPIVLCQSWLPTLSANRAVNHVYQSCHSRPCPTA